MPLSTYLILQAPQVAMTLTTSSSIACVLSDPKTVIGLADTVNYLNVKDIYLGNAYLFDKTNATIITAGGSQYIIIDEENIKGEEIPLP